MAFRKNVLRNRCGWRAVILGCLTRIIASATMRPCLATLRASFADIGRVGLHSTRSDPTKISEPKWNFSGSLAFTPVLQKGVDNIGAHMMELPKTDPAWQILIFNVLFLGLLQPRPRNSLDFAISQL